MKRVMIIDDASTVRLYHRQLLEEIGFEVEEAQNGVEALEKSLGSRYDVFVVDVNMPKMDGYRFIQEIRSDPELCGTPAVMVSTESSDQDREKAFLSGANHYVVKPARPEVLQACVRLLAGEAMT